MIEDNQIEAKVSPFAVKKGEIKYLMEKMDMCQCNKLLTR